MNLSLIVLASWGTHKAELLCSPPRLPCVEGPGVGGFLCCLAHPHCALLFPPPPPADGFSKVRARSGGLGEKGEVL